MTTGDFNINQNLHHAYILAGPHYKTREFVGKIINAHNVELNGPDTFSADYDVFSIADSRKLRQMQSETAFAGSKRFFLLAINFITREAQNALLKTLEEPRSNTHIFLMCKTEDMLLPTVRSRCQIIRFETTEDSKQLKEAEEFIALNPAGQLERLKKTFDFKKPETKKEMLEFFENIEIVLSQKLQEEKSLVRVKQIEILLNAKKKLYRSGLPLRLIGEEVAVALTKN